MTNQEHMDRIQAAAAALAEAVNAAIEDKVGVDVSFTELNFLGGKTKFQADVQCKASITSITQFVDYSCENCTHWFPEYDGCQKGVFVDGRRPPEDFVCSCFDWKE